MLSKQINGTSGHLQNAKTVLVDDLATKKTVRQIYEERSGTDEAPRDSKQIHNLKAKLTKGSNPRNYKNNTDYIQQLISMVSTSHPFLKKVVQSSDKPQNLICYTDHQLKHLKTCCQSSIIGVDRTFNLGPCFVNALVYQGARIKRKGKENAPILGPVYLHYDSLFHTTNDFFSHVSGVVFGDDFEINEVHPHWP